VLDGEKGAVRDIVLLNAAAGIVSYDLFRDATQVQRPIVERMSDARDRAAAAIDDGAAAAFSTGGSRRPPALWPDRTAAAGFLRLQPW
jgi:anthranilate phosphoribosyltransferase